MKFLISAKILFFYDTMKEKKKENLKIKHFLEYEVVFDNFFISLGN